MSELLGKGQLAASLPPLLSGLSIEYVATVRDFQCFLNHLPGDSKLRRVNVFRLSSSTSLDFQALHSVEGLHERHPSVTDSVSQKGITLSVGELWTIWCLLPAAQSNLYRSARVTLLEIPVKTPGTLRLFPPEGSGETARYAYCLDPRSIKLIAALRLPHLGVLCRDLKFKSIYHDRFEPAVINPVQVFQLLLNSMPYVEKFDLEDAPFFHAFADRLVSYHLQRLDKVSKVGIFPAFPVVNAVWHNWSVPSADPFPARLRFSSLALVADLTFRPELFTTLVANSLDTLVELTVAFEPELPLHHCRNLRTLTLLQVAPVYPERHFFAVLPLLAALEKLVLVGGSPGHSFDRVLADSYLGRILPPRLGAVVFAADEPDPGTILEFARSIQSPRLKHVHWPNCVGRHYYLAVQHFASLGIRVHASPLSCN
ncbi:hypothetical protein JCM11491_006526 [Sporobolomyces phaffii]